MLKKSVLVLITFLFVASASAFSTTLTNYNDTLATVSISDTTNLYAYEINFDYSGTISAIQQRYFLGASGTAATYGYNEKNNILSVYGSRLDPNRVGVNGSGNLFNVSHAGAISLRYTLAIFSNGTEDYTYYNSSAEPVNEVGGDDNGNGGGGGGGGGKTIQFGVTPNLLKLTLVGGRTIKENVRLTSFVDKQLQVTSITSGDLNQFIAAYSPQTPFYIPQKGYIDLNIDFFSRKDVKPDVYTGEIQIKTAESTESVPVILEIVEEEPLFDVAVGLDKDEYSPGDTAIAKIDIQNFGDKKDIDALVHYAIKDFGGKELVFEEGSYAIENYRLQLVGKLKIPNDAVVGDKLIFYVRATYPQQDISASASSVFTVVKPMFGPLGSTANLFLLILIPIAAISVIIVTIIIILNVTRKPAYPVRVHPAESVQ